MRGFFQLFFILLLFSCFCGAVRAASTSTSYKIPSEAVCAGSGSGSSASYSAKNLAQSKQTASVSGASYTLGEGFFRSSCFSSSSVLAPIVTSISPESGVATSEVFISNLSGANFESGASVKLSRGGQSDILATTVEVVNSGKITCTVNINNAEAGYWNVTVTNLDGRSGTLSSAFKVINGAPAVTAITPRKGSNTDSALQAVIDGQRFRAGAAVKLSHSGESDIMGENVTVSSASQISCRFNLSGKTAGAWDVVVTNDDNQAGALSTGFALESPVLESPGVIGFAIGATSEPSSLPYIPPGTPTVEGNVAASRATAISYAITKDADITINIYNIRGEKVWTKFIPAGTEGGKTGVNQIAWDGITAFRGIAGPGVYLIHVVGNEGGHMKILNKSKFAIIR